MIENPGLEKIESFFGMSFRMIIETLHWEKERTILSLSNECGISRDTFQRHVKKQGLQLRSRKEARQISSFKTRGKNHWAFGLKKESSEWAKKHSERMKTRNPCMDKEILSRKQESTAKTYRKNPLPQEKLFAMILKSHEVRFKPQYLIEIYIIDFFIPDKNLCIEIDSTYKWGNERKQAAMRKDIFLNKNGFKVLRINKAYLKNKSYIVDVLKTHNVIR